MNELSKDRDDPEFVGVSRSIAKSMVFCKAPPENVSTEKLRSLGIAFESYNDAFLTSCSVVKPQYLTESKWTERHNRLLADFKVFMAGGNVYFCFIR